MIRARILLSFAFLAGGLVSLSCSRETVRLNEGPREYAATDYPTVLKHWTRTEDLIVMNDQETDNVLTVTATYESWDFRWAYVVRYSDDYRLTVDQRRALLERSLAESRTTHAFFLALYAQKWRWNDLKADEPAWIVRLIDDQGAETAPSEIVKIKRPGAIERTYFPYTSPWRSAFRIQFPRAASNGKRSIGNKAKWFGLRFAGAQGNQALVWELASGSSSDETASRIRQDGKIYAWEIEPPTSPFPSLFNSTESPRVAER